jgi:hypothetical protein
MFSRLFRHADNRGAVRLSVRVARLDMLCQIPRRAKVSRYGNHGNPRQRVSPPASRPPLLVLSGYIRVVVTRTDNLIHYSTVYQGAVIHALSRASLEDADAATSGRPVEVSALHNVADIWN